MRKILLLTSCWFIYSLSFGQSPISLTKKASFGLNHHTNRDDAFFTTVDNEKNTILIGTTERDSTFVDILTTKLDEDYRLVWQKRLSVETNLSYDIPLKVFTNSTNDIFVFGRSSTNASKVNGILFYAKYDKNGELIYSKTIGKLDGSEYHDFGYFDVILNRDNTFNLVYSKHTYQGYGSKDFIFLKINSAGNTIKLFEKELINAGINSKILEDKFYFFIRKYKNPDNESEGFLHYVLNIEKDGLESSLLIDNEEFYNYDLNNNYENFNMDVDKNKNLYITTLNSSDNDTKGKINVSLIGADNLFKYTHTSASSDNYYLLGSFINSSNKPVIIVNDLNKDKLLFLTVNESNQFEVLKEINSYLGTGFKFNKDGSFFITTSNSNIRLFSNDLNEINSFNNSNSYLLVDLSKIDDNSITSFGIEIKKMYPESDYSTQLNIVAEKTNNTNVLNRYTFSGEGTSANFQQIIHIDNNNDYLVFSTEKLGPECFHKWCEGTAPLSGKIIKFNSELNVLWELDLTGQINNIASNYYGNNIKIDAENNIFLNLDNKEGNKSYLYKISSEGKLVYKKESIKSKEVVINTENNKVYIITDQIINTDLTTGKTSIWTEIMAFNSTTGDLIDTFKYDHLKYFNHLIYNNKLYIYFLNISTADHYSKDHIVYLYNEGDLVFERKIELEKNSTINPHKPIIKNNGTLLFSSDSHINTTEWKLHKITIDNKYSNSIIQEKLWKLVFLNNKIFATDQNQYLNIYNDDLKLVKKSDLKFNNCCSGFNYSVMNNQLFIQWSNPDGNNSAFLNENLDLISEFKFENLIDKNFKFDKNNNLITTSTYGNGIHLEPSFSWRRGLLSKYSLSNVLNIEENTILTSKEIITIYPNPISTTFTIKLHKGTLKKVAIYSINGQLLDTFFTKKINLLNYPKGLYLLKIFTSDNTTINTKIIKN